SYEVPSLLNIRSLIQRPCLVWTTPHPMPKGLTLRDKEDAGQPCRTWRQLAGFVTRKGLERSVGSSVSSSPPPKWVPLRSCRCLSLLITLDRHHIAWH